MKQCGQVPSYGGFTLLEVMITLAISSVMLVTAIIAFGGQQRRTSFQQGMRDIESRVRDVLNDVSVGYYPTNLSNCLYTTSGPFFRSTSSEQGKNFDCVFVGKAIHFQDEAYTIYSVVGNQKNEIGTNIQNFHESLPVLDEATKADTNYGWGLRLKEMYADGAAPVTGTTLVVLASTVNATGSVSGAPNELNSGIQRVIPYVSGYPVGSEAFTNSSSSDLKVAIQAIGGFPTSNKLTLCFEDASSGVGRQFEGIVIEGGRKPASVRRQTDSDTPRCT